MRLLMSLPVGQVMKAHASLPQGQNLIGTIGAEQRTLVQTCLLRGLNWIETTVDCQQITFHLMVQEALAAAGVLRLYWATSRMRCLLHQVGPKPIEEEAE